MKHKEDKKVVLKIIKTKKKKYYSQLKYIKNKRCVQCSKNKRNIENKLKNTNNIIKKFY